MLISVPSQGLTRDQIDDSRHKLRGGKRPSKEAAEAHRDVTVVHGWAHSLQHIGEAGSIEEVSQLCLEDAQLVHEVVGVVAFPLQPLHQPLCGHQILRTRIAMQFVLDGVLDLLLRPNPGTASRASHDRQHLRRFGVTCDCNQSNSVVAGCMLRLNAVAACAVIIIGFTSKSNRRLTNVGAGAGVAPA